jgi:hypothetical protein
VFLPRVDASFDNSFDTKVSFELDVDNSYDAKSRFLDQGLAIVMTH